MNAIEEVDRMSPEARAAYEAAKIEEEKARQKAEEEANKSDINDQTKYLVDQKIEVLKTLN